MKRLLLAVSALVALTFAALAQTTNGAPVTPVAGLPGSMQEYWMLGIAALTPLIVTGVWKLVPNVPKWALPTMTPVLGILLGMGVNWLGNQQLAWVDMAQAGALAVFIREVFNQAITKNLIVPAQATPPPPPPPSGA